MKPLALIIALVAFSTSAFAHGKYKDLNELSLVRSIKVFINDGVTDGCLPNPNSLKVEAELVLRRSNIEVSESLAEQGAFALDVSPTGFELMAATGPTGSCAIMLNVELHRSAFVTEGHAVIVPSYRQATVFAHAKSGAQYRLRSLVSEFVSDLANEILKARGQ